MQTAGFAESAEKRVNFHKLRSEQPARLAKGKVASVEATACFDPPVVERNRDLHEAAVAADATACSASSTPCSAPDEVVDGVRRFS